MRVLKSLVLSSILLAGSAYGEDFGFNLGPFNMQFDASGGDYVPDERNMLDSPICNAITNQKQLEIIVEGSEVVSAKEKKIITKRLVVEPHAFGITRRGKPVLHGNIVKEKLIKEVSVKFGDDRFDDSKDSKQKGKGYFSGMYSTGKDKDIDIRKVSDIHVIQDSHFKAPKHYKGLKDSKIQIVCELPVEEKN